MMRDNIIDTQNVPILKDQALNKQLRRVIRSTIHAGAYETVVNRSAKKIGLESSAERVAAKSISSVTDGGSPS